MSGCNVNKMLTSKIRNVRLNHTWVKPEGFDTNIKLFNCIAKEKVPLIIKNKNYLTWYTCGPTVYDSSHVGHASCYVKLDIIQRIIKQHFKINIVSVMNITDIDDKIVKRAQEKKVTTTELSKYYETEFLEDLNSLNIERPNQVVRVTENISLIKNFIEKLVKEKKAYQAKDNSVYFDVGSYTGSYGKLQKIGDAIGEKGVKKSAADFALWKSTKEGEPSWDSCFGPGRPGWHIECSAIAGTTLGSTIDIHAGGIDLRFPHHENEEAQSCAYFNKQQWVNYWIHAGHLCLKDNKDLSIKMSKSLKNTISIREMLAQWKPDVFRMACLMSHYSNVMEYSSEMLSNADSYLRSYKNFFDTCNLFISGTSRGNLNNDTLNENLAIALNEINEALTDDFNTSSCIKSLNKLISSTNKILHTSSDTGVCQLDSLIAIKNFVANTLQMFGLNLEPISVMNDDNEFVKVVDILVNFRCDLRMLGIGSKNKDILKLCDDVRDEMKKCGIYLKDGNKVSTWSK